MWNAVEEEKSAASGPVPSEDDRAFAVATYDVELKFDSVEEKNPNVADDDDQKVLDPQGHKRKLTVGETRQKDSEKQHWFFLSIRMR